MKFIHFSDMHFDPTNDGRATRDLREKFELYCKEKNITHIDEVFFTGDFRHAKNQAKQDSDIVARNAVDFLLEISKCVGVTKSSHIHIVPGNHDLDREKDAKLNQEILKTVYSQYEPYDGCFNGEINGFQSLDYLRSRFDFFEKCLALLDNKIWTCFKCGLIHRYMDYGDFSIVYLNTAIASGSDEDRHNLLIGTNDFDTILRLVGEKPIIVLAHNPLSHLAYNEQNTIKNMIRDRRLSVLWLCGDVHETQYDNSYNIACLSAGCMIKQKGTEASFFVGEVSKYNGVVLQAHGYSAKHGYWQVEEAITKRVNESIPETLKPIPSVKLPRVNNIAERNAYFTGRESQIKTIAEVFKSNSKIVIKQTISGLGGIGKTQLAREFAYRYSWNYQTAIWEINAESSSTIYNSFVLLAQSLQLTLPKEFKEDELRRTIKSWMQENSNWLIIFDNLDFEEFIMPYLPNNNISGNIIVTTRSSNMSVGNCIDLEVFELCEATTFLSNRLSDCNWIDNNDEEIKVKLVERLGRFPLALEQAAAYIKVTRTKYYRYLDLLEESGLSAFDFDETEFNKPQAYEKSVTTTWEISFSAIAHESSKQLFYLCSYMASEKIPVALFVKKREMLPESIRNDLSSIYNTNKIVTELRAYSLIGGDSEYISVHRLVQEVVRKKIASDNSWLLYCLAIIRDEFRYEWGNFTSMTEFPEKSPHALSVSKNSEQYLKNNENAMVDVAWLYHEIGTGFMQSGQYYDSARTLKKALEIREKFLGTEHSDTASTYSELALLYDNQGNYPEALKLNQKALAVQKKLLGDKHPDIVISYNNAALIYTHQGDYDKALEWYSKALCVSEDILGKEHPTTTVIYNNIAAAYYRKGNYSKSLEWHQKALTIREKILGKEHPDIATTYSNMASAYHQQGDYLKSLEWHQKALTIKEKILGKKHPATATTYDCIAFEYYSMGDYFKALDWYQKALMIREISLGFEHPDTATTYNNIGLVYDSLGNYQKALEWYQKALEIREKVLGTDHPHTATVYNNIANVHSNQKEYLKALEWYQKALEIRERILGTEHPATAATYHNIGVVYEGTGDYLRALMWYQKAYPVRRKALGDEHPDTRKTRESIELISLQE